MYNFKRDLVNMLAYEIFYQRCGFFRIGKELPESVRVERRERFMEVQSEISKELLREKVGKTIKVLVDEAPDEDGIATARSTADAPDIDGLVFIENNPNVKPGDFVDVKVTDSSDYDLFGEVVKEP